MVNLPKMRTLPELAREISAHDPDTHLTLPVLRRMVKSGIIPCVYSGRRALVNMDTVGAHLDKAHNPVQQEQAKIRRIGAG